MDLDLGAVGPDGDTSADPVARTDLTVGGQHRPREQPVLVLDHVRDDAAD
jgi:hypothetical protein